MHFAMRSNSALSKTFRGFQKLSEVFRDFQRFSEALRGFQKLSEVFRDFQRFYFLRQNAFGICFQSVFWKNPQKSECSKVCCSGSESCVRPFRTCPACRSRAWIDLGISIECFHKPQEAAILRPWEIKLGSVLDSWFRLHTRQGFVHAFVLLTAQTASGLFNYMSHCDSICTTISYHFLKPFQTCFWFPFQSFSLSFLLFFSSFLPSFFQRSRIFDKVTVKFH